MAADVIIKGATPPWEQWVGASLLLCSFAVLVVAGVCEQRPEEEASSVGGSPEAEDASPGEGAEGTGEEGVSEASAVHGQQASSAVASSLSSTSMAVATGAVPLTRVATQQRSGMEYGAEEHGATVDPQHAHVLQRAR